MLVDTNEVGMVDTIQFRFYYFIFKMPPSQLLWKTIIKEKWHLLKLRAILRELEISYAAGTSGSEVGNPTNQSEIVQCFDKIKAYTAGKTDLKNGEMVY